MIRWPASTRHRRRCWRPSDLGCSDRSLKGLGVAVLVVAVISMVTWVPAVWVFALTSGLALSLVFFSITLITGAAGQISLCQAAFAGVGAFTAGQLATNRGVPIVTGALIGALVAAVAGVLAVLPAAPAPGPGADALDADHRARRRRLPVFPTSYIGGPSSGLTVPRPTLGPISFATESTRPFFLLVLVFVIVAGFFVRRILLGSSGAEPRGRQAEPPGRRRARLQPLEGQARRLRPGCRPGRRGWRPLRLPAPGGEPGRLQLPSSLLFVVVVVTVGARTVAGAIEAGIAYAVSTRCSATCPTGRRRRALWPSPSPSARSATPPTPRAWSRTPGAAPRPGWTASSSGCAGRRSSSGRRRHELGSARGARGASSSAASTPSKTSAWRSPPVSGWGSSAPTVPARRPSSG